MDIKCPHCGTEYEIDKSEHGRFVDCPTCGKGFVVGTSAAKKLGEAAKAVNDAVKIAANVAYEHMKNIDWKAQQEHAKAIGKTTYRNGKKFWESLKDKYDECGWQIRLSRWLYAVRVAIKDFVDGPESRKVKLRIVGVVIVICLSLFILSMLVGDFKESTPGMLSNEKYESSELSYDLASVNQMECTIEKGVVNELELDCVPYDLAAAVLFSPNNSEGNAPSFGTAYKYNMETLTFRIQDIYQTKGVLVRLEQAMYSYSNGLKYSGVKKHDKFAFIRTNRDYKIGEELQPGYYILCGGAQCKLRMRGSDRHRVLKVLAFWEMDEDIIEQRGLRK